MSHLTMTEEQYAAYLTKRGRLPGNPEQRAMAQTSAIREMQRDRRRHELAGTENPGPLPIELAWPPTVNHYCAHAVTKAGKSIHYMTKEANRYRQDVIYRCRQAGIWRLQLRDRLKVVMHATPPDRRTRDLDNYFKAILDGLTHAKVWIDDSQVDDLRMLRFMGTPGTVNCFISTIPDLGSTHGATD